MTLSNSRSIAAAFVCLASMAVAMPMTPAAAHDSNTLHKLGKAIEYPIRKTSENTAVALHRGEGRKSVVHRRNGNRTYRSVVTSGGDIHRMYRVGYHPRHRRHHH